MITPKTTSIWFSHELCFGLYTNRIRWLGSDKNAWRLAIDFSTPEIPFLPRAMVIWQARATYFISFQQHCVFIFSIKESDGRDDRNS
jgi:hypothetical protein